MKKEDFIKGILDSSKGIQKAEPPAFLFEKISASIRSEEGGKTSSNSWVFAAAASVLIVLNVFCMSTVSFNNDTTEVATSEDGYELVQQVTYNY